MDLDLNILKNTIISPVIERVRMLRAVTEESTEEPKVAFTMALVFFIAAAMTRLPEEMKRAKIDVTATQICHSFFLYIFGATK